MTRSNRAFALGLLIGICCGIYLLGQALDYMRHSDDVTGELMYFPSGRLLKIASLGFDTVASDLLWLKGIQYYGKHRRSDKYYPLAEHIFSVITDLDPHFLGAYRFGAFVLAQDVSQPALGIDLLTKGLRNNPGSWQMPFDIGFLYFTMFRDNFKAAHYFRMASRFDQAPDIARRFTAFAYKQAGETAVARQLWEGIYRSSDNRVMRETAERAMKNIDLDQMAGTLTGASCEFKSRYDRFPARLEELVEVGLLEEIPDDPFGGNYVFDHATETVLSTSRARSQGLRVKHYLERVIRRYVERVGHYPQTLSALVDEGLTPELPEIPGIEITYDVVVGSVEYILRSEEANE